MARNSAPVEQEKGRGNASLFLFFSLVFAVAGCLLVHGCADTKPYVNPEDDSRYRMDTGFTGDLSVPPTLGHTVPTEGEVISTPQCVAEAREGKECAK